MEIYGSVTPPALFITNEAHKLHRAFTVASGVQVRRTQPVKLTTTGEITPLVQGDNSNLSIGISIHDSNAGEEATVIMKGYATITAKATAAALNAGLVSYEGYTSVNPTTNTVLPSKPNEPLYGNILVAAAAATDADILGWAVEAAASGAYVEVVVR